MQKKMKIALVGGAAAVVFGLGAAAGGSGKAEATPAPVSSPAPTVTVTPAPEIKTVTVTKEVAPASCLDALTKAEQVIDIAGDTIGVMSQGFKAASEMDVAGVSAVAPQINAKTAQLKEMSPSFLSAKADCRAAAK